MAPRIITSLGEIRTTLKDLGLRAQALARYACGHGREARKLPGLAGLAQLSEAIATDSFLGCCSAHHAHREQGASAAGSDEFDC